MYNTYTQKKQNVLSDEERKLKRESILKKESGEPQWVKDITKGMLADNDSAVSSGVTKNIAKTDSYLTRWDNELNQLNLMTKDRKEQEHVKSFVTGSYPRVKVNPNTTFEHKSSVDLPGERKSSESMSDILRRLMNTRSKSPQGIYSSRLPLVQKIMEESKARRGLNYGNNSFYNSNDVQKLKSSDEFIDITTPDGEISNHEKTKEEQEREDRNYKIWADSTYLTSKDEDLSSNFGTTIERQDNVNNKGSQLGMDTKESRKKASKIIVEHKDTIIEMGEKYGINPAILASVIFTEQACNVGSFEGFTDLTKGAFDSSASLGIAQIQIELAMSLEKNYIKDPIKCVGYDSKGFEKWKIPGEIYEHVGTFRTAVVERMLNPKQSIEYAAAYLACIRDTWKGAYSKIDGDTAISATLYNIGLKNKPHGNPGTNDFGRYARANYYYMESLLGWSAK